MTKHTIRYQLIWNSTQTVLTPILRHNARFRSRTVCLQEAKRNVETMYLVVGVSENIPGFLLILEKLLPQFFSGAVKQYVDMCKYDVTKVQL